MGTFRLPYVQVTISMEPGPDGRPAVTMTHFPGATDKQEVIDLLRLVLNQIDPAPEPDPTPETPFITREETT